MENDNNEVKLCTRCEVPLEDRVGAYGRTEKVCPICDTREIDMDDEDEYDRKERR